MALNLKPCHRLSESLSKPSKTGSINIRRKESTALTRFNTNPRKHFSKWIKLRISSNGYRRQILQKQSNSENISRNNSSLNKAYPYISILRILQEKRCRIDYGPRRSSLSGGEHYPFLAINKNKSKKKKKNERKHRLICNNYP